MTERVSTATRLLLALLVVCGVQGVYADDVSFRHDVLPVLSDRCFTCHGPDAENRAAGLRLDVEESAKEYVIVPGKPGESELLRRITSEDPDERMPPPDAKQQLSREEIDVIRRWIKQGASWERHWAFSPVDRPEVPGLTEGSSDSSKTKPAPAEAAPSENAARNKVAADNKGAAGNKASALNESRVRNEIDAFIIRRLRQKGLALAPEASREKLIRRVTFDLTGLPPTLDEVDAFLQDDQPGAWGRVVDRLLESRACGERMAADWLDVARYSDTYGYQVDRDRFVWPWRDWVVRAFNNNMPYDRFITEQLAGDLLPEATDDQIVATTFNRLHPQKVEGGSVPEEFRVEYVSDRTQTFGTAFLGLTLECCRCHDHKYDPLTQKDYYEFSAFFDNIDEAGLYSYFTSSVPTPTLALSDEDTKARIAELEQKIDEAEANVESVATSRTQAFEQWLTQRRDALLSGSSDLSGVSGVSDGEVAERGRQERSTQKASSAGKASGPESEPEVKSEEAAAGDADASSRSLSNRELIPGQIASLGFESPVSGGNRLVPGRFGKAVKLSGDDGIGLKVGNFKRFEPFSVSLWLNTPDIKERAVVFHRSRAWTDAGSRGYQLLIEDGKLSASLIHFWPGNAIRIRTRQPVTTDQWHHVVVAWDGSSRADGLTLYLNGKPADCEVVRNKLTRKITGGGGDHITIGQRFRDRGFTNGLVDEFKVFDRRLTELEAAQLFDGKRLLRALKRGASNDAVRQYYLVTADSEYQQALEELRKRRKRLSKALGGLREIMVMRERGTPRQTWLLARGAYDARAEKVFPDTPESLPPFPDDQPRNRLGLARWLTSPEHPLTSRVAVNRLWQSIFGHGLVRTPEDFGRQGKRPTHPELLDWLARDFVEHGWDVKRLLRQIVMSATYRQSSTASPEAMQLDPQNRLLSRSPTFRLPAEMLRDQALAVSGLLVRKVGGPPAKPYEVEVSFKPVKRSSGEGLYRRSLYTYWKRTGPAPVMMTLDASKRDVCRMRRERTSTPLEAFVLMNGPQFVEASRVLSERLMKEHPDSRPPLRSLFRTLTSREPVDSELSILEDLYSEQLEYFEADDRRAARYLKTGARAPDGTLNHTRLAALASVANALFSFDEVTNRR